MPLRFSSGLVKKMVDTGSVRSLLTGGKILIFAGAQPASADDAPTTSALLTMGNMAAPVQSAISGSGTGGTLAAATYYYVVTALNAMGETVASNETNYVATGSTSSVTVSWAAVTGATSYRIYRGTGAGAENTYFSAAAGATSYVDTGAAGTAGSPPGADTSGIKFDTDGTGGILKQLAATDWSGTVANSGTAGWFRICAPTDAGTGSSTTEARMDGSIATSGGQMNLASLTFTAGAPFTVTDAQITFPKE